MDKAQELVDAHNRDRNPETIEEFRSELRDFLQAQFSKRLDSTDEQTGRNYWYVLGMMVDGATEMLLSATQPISNFMKLK